jgi:hypothetical protein
VVSEPELLGVDTRRPWKEDIEAITEKIFATERDYYEARIEQWTVYFTSQ